MSLFQNICVLLLLSAFILFMINEIDEIKAPYDTITFPNITTPYTNNSTQYVYIHPCVKHTTNNKTLVINIPCINRMQMDMHSHVLVIIGIMAFLLIIASVCVNPPSCAKPRRANYAHVQEEGGSTDESKMSANVALELASTSQPQTCAIEEHVDMDIELSPIEEEED